MKNSTFSKHLTIHWATQAIRHLLCTILFLFSAQLCVLEAQASLSIEGILKKSNGVAVEDGTYNITFKLYTVESGGSRHLDGDAKRC